MAQAASATHTNGFAPAIVDHKAQAAFYEQLLQLRDAVLSDRHPRFKLPAAAKQKLDSLSGSSASSHGAISGSATDQQGGVQTATNTQHYGKQQDGVQNVAAFEANRSAHSSQPATVMSHLSGIDPVLLTKSDDLIRAEIHLKRQRIEKQLKESVDQRKSGFRRDTDTEPATLIDLPEILQKAWDIVKPISGLKPLTNTQTTASDSFDENSYYSSQVNDWSSESSADSRRGAAAAAVTATTSVPNTVQSNDVGLASKPSLSKHRPSEHEKQYDQQAPVSAEEGLSLFANDTEGAYDAEREDSEEYSPPAAEAFSGADGADGDAMDLDDDSSEFVPEEPAIPSPQQAQVVTNLLTHIAAPQPARVSPLAMAKIPAIGRSSLRSQASQSLGSRGHARAVSEDSTTSPRNSGAQSPKMPLSRKQKTRQRKKRREEVATEKKLKRQETAASAKAAPAARSPEPYIKPEPVSPLPFADMSTLHDTKSRAQYELPPDVEIVSPRDFRPRPPREPYYQEQAQPQVQPQAPPPPPPPHMAYESPASPTVIRVSSPSGYQRPRRDDQDLRRVASLHAARRPMSPVYSPVAPYRTMSQSYTEQPSPASFGSYQPEVARAPSRYIRSERSMSPPQLRAGRESYVQRLHSPAMMAPPPLPPARRIIVDQYGNRYIAADDAGPMSAEASLPPPPPPPPMATRMSVAPPARYEGETAYERAPSRASVVYAPQAGSGGYDDGRMFAPPPPPPPSASMRRVTVQPEGEGVDYRAYRQREYSRHAEPQYYREEPVYMREAPPPASHRASAYPADPVAPGYARAYSVRPEAEAVRYVSRAPSVMPQPEYVRVADHSSAAPAPSTRAVSVAPGPEYGGGREAEGRYGYGQPMPYPMPPPAPRRVEIYVDEYGREIRRGPAY
ncbi:hypothetical protein AAFC00_002247 [Neodothiora populina]|uniref:Uncharacterized protein n=1 Tax=Neodothiora populina TaxID=2781224 RepID=A0ABR3PGS5_9PEZI